MKYVILYKESEFPRIASGEWIFYNTPDANLRTFWPASIESLGFSFPSIMIILGGTRHIIIAKFFLFISPL